MHALGRDGHYAGRLQSRVIAKTGMMENRIWAVLLAMVFVTVSLEFARYQATRTCESAGHILQEDQRDLQLNADGVIDGNVMVLDCGDWWGKR